MASFPAAIRDLPAIIPTVRSKLRSLTLVNSTSGTTEQGTTEQGAMEQGAKEGAKVFPFYRPLLYNYSLIHKFTITSLVSQRKKKQLCKL